MGAHEVTIRAHARLRVKNEFESAAVLGAGAWGTALGMSLARAGAALLQLAGRLNVDAPLAQAVSDLLSGKVSAARAVEDAFAWRRQCAAEAARAA